jgi:pimeloyl-ACP methyl ester carboxylesterase
MTDENAPFIYECGVKDGTPLVFFHGFPGSHKQGFLLEPHAARFGLRILAPDRPGYGYSQPLPGKGLREFVAQLERALDRLGVQRFYLLGVSGGNPAAVTAAGHFGSRVLALGSLCGLAPYPESRDLVYKFIRTGFDLARKTPEFFMRMTINQFIKGFDPRVRLDEMIAKLSPADQECLSDPAIRESLYESIELARRQGGLGIIFDLKSVSQPWPVDFAAIKCPHFIWHGLEDRVLPHSLSELLHRKIPHSKLKLFAGEGHYSLPLQYSAEILSDLTGKS